MVDAVFVRLARWINAPTTGLELINDNIMRNHGVRMSLSVLGTVLGSEVGYRVRTEVNGHFRSSRIALFPT